MADVGTKRQREDQPASSGHSTGQSLNLTGSERNRQFQGQGSQGMERYQQGRHTPSVFSVSPGEFFTMSPITLMRRFTEDIDRAFGLSTGRSRSDLDFSTEDVTWMPTVEVRQQGNNLVIHADLPGLAEKDVQVEATDDGLVIQGERRREQTVEDLGIVRSERVYGRFYRLIPLPEGAKIEEAKANFWGGVLEVTVPVPQSARQNRQIPVSASQPAQSMQSGQSLTSEQGDRSRAAGSGR
jgi:HSP20 family protein